MKILVADDEVQLARAVGMILELNKNEVTIVNNGKAALEKAVSENFDCILLDVMMPKMNGVEVVKALREKNVDTPVLMLTAKAEVEDKVEGLDAGANDYLTKPFNKDELLARVRALTRESKKAYKKISVGNVTLDREENVVYTDKASFHLNAKECQVMETLISNQGSVMEKAELKNKVWGNEESLDVVPMYISFLQDKFEALGADIKINDDNGYLLERKL